MSNASRDTALLRAAVYARVSSEQQAQQETIASQVAALRERGVGTLIHYPIPLHLQPAFASLGGKPGDHPVAERASAEILSLPLYPELTDDQARAVVEAVRGVARGL